MHLAVSELRFVAPTMSPPSLKLKFRLWLDDELDVYRKQLKNENAIDKITDNERTVYP